MTIIKLEQSQGRSVCVEGRTVLRVALLAACGTTHLSFVRFLQPLAQTNQTALLHGGEVAKVTADVVGVQLVYRQIVKVYGSVKHVQQQQKQQSNLLHL